MSDDMSDDMSEQMSEQMSDANGDVSDDTVTRADEAISDPSAAAAAAAALDRAVRSTPKRTPSRTTNKKRSSASRSRDPLLLGQAVDDLLAERGWVDDSAIATLVARWSEIVGAELADHVIPVAFEDATLQLQAESTSWATQVRLLLPDLQRVVDQEVGTGVVRQIRVQGPQAPSWSKGSRRVQGRGPRDTYG